MLALSMERLACYSSCVQLELDSEQRGQAGCSRRPWTLETRGAHPYCSIVKRLVDFETELVSALADFPQGSPLPPSSTT